MSLEFPDWVNPWKAADGNRIYRGTIRMGKLTRLVPLLAKVTGEVAFEASFANDGLGFATIDLKVNADLQLVCQASLESFVLPVERNSLLAVIDDIDQQELVPGHYETVWVESKRLELLELVQDELILEVPQVPRKPGIEDVIYSTDPDGDLEIAREDQNKPFAALEGFLHGEHQDSQKDQD